MTVPNLKSTILPKLLAGTRDGLPLATIGATDPLQALALTGQMLRFDRPPQPTQFNIEEPVGNMAAIMPDAARRFLLRLLSGKSQASVQLSAAIARRLAERKVRLHPFDLPKLEPFVKTHAESLGAEALAFTERETPVAQKQNYFAPERLSDETWMLATPALKAGYISDRRASAPDAARALVEAAWGSENADNRLRLLGTFRHGLSEADGPFLKSLEKDRAPRVRELAERLLVRLPGYAGDNPPLRAALERIKVEKAGLIFKKTSLRLELPATVKDHTRIAWLNETFGPVGLEALALGLSMLVDAMIAAAEKQPDLLLAFLFMATQDRRLDVVEAITDRYLTNGWEGFLQASPDMLADYDLDTRQRWTELVFRPSRWSADTPAWTIRRMADWIGGSTRAPVFNDILKSRVWQALRKGEDRFDGDILDSMAVMCPATLRSTLRTELAAFDSAKSSNAILFLDFMNSLETAHA